MTDPETRIVSHETGDTRHIAVLRRSPETDQMSDEEIIARLQEWRRTRNTHADDE